MTTMTLAPVKGRRYQSVTSGCAHFGTAHTVADRSLAEATFVAAGAVNAYTTASGQYVGFERADRTVVGYLYAGYLTVTEHAAAMPAQDESTGRHTISTVANYQPHAWDLYLSGFDAAPHGPKTPEAQWGPVCPVHFVTRSVSGNCFQCDE